MTIIIEAKRDGFRRCGIAHPGKPTKYADDFFTEEQLKALAKEPQLICAYEEDEFDQVQDEPNENLQKAALPQAPDTAPAAQSQAPEAVITPLAAPVVTTADAVLVGDVPGAGKASVLVGTSDDALGPLNGQASEAVIAPVVTPVVSSADPVEGGEPVEARPEKARTAKVKDGTK